MSADRPQPRPSFLGVGKTAIRRTRNAETAGAEPAAQTIFPERFDQTDLTATRSGPRGDLFRSLYRQHWTPDHLTPTTA